MATTTSTPQHQIFVKIAGELIGISILAVFADMNDDLGSIMVMLMIGWFVLFLMINATDISGVFGKLNTAPVKASVPGTLGRGVGVA